MADIEEDQDLVDYDEEEEEENVVAEKSAESDSKEVKKWVSNKQWPPWPRINNIIGRRRILRRN